MAGWICLHRDIQEHWVFDFNEPDKALAWIDLLLLANHNENKFFIKGFLIECKRGQVAQSQLSLQKRWKMSQNKLKRFLVLLKKEGMIDFETNELTTLITICNYSAFQPNAGGGALILPLSLVNCLVKKKKCLFLSRKRTS